MALKSCAAGTWTELTSAAGPSSILVQRLTLANVWIAVAASAPSDSVAGPEDDTDADIFLVGDVFPAWASDKLSGTTLKVFARPASLNSGAANVIVVEGI